VGAGGRPKKAKAKKSKVAAAAAVDAMEEDEAGEGASEGDGRTTEAEVKELVEGVLAAESLEGKRAAGMDIDDLLALLSAFNEKGVHCFVLLLVSVVAPARPRMLQGVSNGW